MIPFLPLLLLLPLSALTLPGAAAVHYVDDRGDDAADGRSPATAWKTLARVAEPVFGPGDTVRFRAGGTWTGTLAFKGSGSAAAPLVIGRYGEGPRPLIQGAGASRAVSLDNQSYVEIHGLEITNKAATEGDRLGIRVNASGAARRHIRIIDCHVHDVKGNSSFGMEGKNTGGIGFFLGTGGSYDGILVEGCTIGDLTRVGIFTRGPQTQRGQRTVKNFVLRNSVIHGCDGDGLILRHAEGALIEKNLAYDNHDGDEARVEYGVALWATNSDRTVFQHNEIYGTKGKLDGQAFDADMAGTYETLIQHNWSHENEGGFMLVYGQSHDAIVRFNISQDDGRVGGHIFDFPVWETPRGSGIFHNNTVWLGEGNKAVIADEALATARFHNNIFVTRGGGKLFVPSGGQNAVFDNNAYHGYAAADVAVDRRAVIGDPLLAAPGTGGKGFGSAGGYRLKAGSPCIGKGLGRADMGPRYWAPDLGPADFFGLRLHPERIDLGAHQASSPDSLGVAVLRQATQVPSSPGGMALRDGRLRYRLPGPAGSRAADALGRLDRAPLPGPAAAPQGR